jgi:hypothetical protein
MQDIFSTSLHVGSGTGCDIWSIWTCLCSVKQIKSAFYSIPKVVQSFMCSLWTQVLVSSWFSSDFLPLELKNNLPEVSQIFKEAQIVDYTITEEETVPGSGEVCASDVHR